MKAFYRLFYYISIVLTSILAGVTIAGAFVGNAAPDSFKFMPFIGLMLPILLLANLASVIYWTIRWRCWVFIPLIAIFSNWSYISCVIQSPFFSPASAPMVKMNAYTPGILTVATYNVDAFNHEHTGYSCKEIASYMRNLQADILCFQEFGINDEFGVDSIAAVLSDWPYYSLFLPRENICCSWLFSAVTPSRRRILSSILIRKIAVSGVILRLMAVSSACSTIISKQRK